MDGFREKGDKRGRKGARNDDPKYVVVMFIVIMMIIILSVLIVIIIDLWFDSNHESPEFITRHHHTTMENLDTFWSSVCEVETMALVDDLWWFPQFQ